MTLSIATAKMATAHNSLMVAVAERNAMAVIVSREQTGFERMVVLADAVNSAERAEDWASVMLVKAISQSVRMAA